MIDFVSRKPPSRQGPSGKNGGHGEGLLWFRKKARYCRACLREAVWISVVLCAALLSCYGIAIVTGVGYNVVGRSEYVRKVELVLVAFCWRYPRRSVRNEGR